MNIIINVPIIYHGRRIKATIIFSNFVSNILISALQRKIIIIIRGKRILFLLLLEMQTIYMTAKLRRYLDRDSSQPIKQQDAAGVS